MRIIGVMDLMAGVVVHAVAGRRGEYRPLVSPLCASSTPLAVAQALVRKAGVRELYVADLDAIAGRDGHRECLTALGEEVETLWIDTGLSSIEKVSELQAAVDSVSARFVMIVGLETVASYSSLPRLLDAMDRDRVAFSLDLCAGRPMTQVPAWQDVMPLEIARQLMTLGIRRFVVLDVRSVGVSGGCTTLGICRQLRGLGRDLEIVSGGGVRDHGDLAALQAAGCDAALVASALHSGAVSLKA